MTRDEKIMAGMIPVCEGCGEYCEDVETCPRCHSPICEECQLNGQHDVYEEELATEYDERDQT